jgi:prepilin-type N-terminal cleavage/methylation domain-containing protein/prepilin-type processing-associated H-X9-DG protein
MEMPAEQIPKPPSIAVRIWWTFVTMSWWNWTLLSLLLGMLGIWLYGQRDTVPRNPNDRVSLDVFLDQLTGERLPNGKPVVSDVEIYPWNDGVRLVTYKLATANGNAIEYSNHFLYEISQAGTPPQNITQLANSVGASTQVVHWIGPPVKLIILLGGTALLTIGIIWPILLNRLRRQGYAPNIPEPIAPPPPTQAPEIPTQSAPPKLSGQPLVPEPTPAEKHKKYRGEFYPVEHPGENAFTLVELLVVIGIIAILIAIILPTLSGARRAAETLQCASNLRSIGLGITVYLDQNAGTFPPAYLYVNESIDDGVETPTSAADGYVHWSTYLYSSGTTPQASAFQCPAMNRGGLPPDNTTPDNVDPGQVVSFPGIIDQQVPRLAYTLNEALCPRNKFVLGFQGAVRYYQYVKVTEVADSTETILGTEWSPTGARIGDTNGGYECVSHGAVHGFVGLNGQLDMYLLPPGNGFRQVETSDLDPDPTSGTAYTTRLDWVGRNHGQLRGYPDKRRSNFLYVDGHVETKTIYETLTPFQWGKQFYSLNPNDDLEQ